MSQSCESWEVDECGGVGEFDYLLNESLALGNVLLEFRDGLVDEFLFVVRDFTQTVDLLNTVGTQFNVAREVFDTFAGEQVRLDKGRFDDALLAADGSVQDSVGKTSTSESHRKRSGARAVLGLDNFVTTKLDTVGQGIEFFLGEGLAGLGKKRDNGHTRVATDNSDLAVLGVLTLDFSHEARSTDDVQSSDTVQTLGVIDTGLLQGLGKDGDSRVDRVRDDQEVSLGAVPNTPLTSYPSSSSFPLIKLLTWQKPRQGHEQSKRWC